MNELEDVNTVTVYTYGQFTEVWSLIEHMGQCEEGEGQMVWDVLGGSKPVASTRFPDGTFLCGNLLADIYACLIQFPHVDIECEELERDLDIEPTSGLDPYVIPADAVKRN